MPSDASVPVRWEVAADDGMRRIVKWGTVLARPEWGHAVHVEVRGLLPDRWYWYRFHVPGAETPVARTRTLPSVASKPQRMRFAFCSCQHYEWGYYAAHRQLSHEDVDFVVFLGDYIYESSIASGVRRHNADEPQTLEQYRNRYALYKLDDNLQLAHRAFPWIVTWDDHEVDNNYAGLVSENDDPVETFRRRRAAAYQAFYEHMPVRRQVLPQGPNALLYRRFGFGRLATLHVLDGRQYRDNQACGDRTKPPCDEWRRDDRSMLGAVQETWLSSGLANAGTTWHVLGNQVVMMPIDLDPGPGELYNMDSWSGYPAARTRLTTAIAERRIQNVVAITGDVHASYAGEVPGSPRSRTNAAVEYVGTSMTSDGDGSEGLERVRAIMPSNPHLKFHHNRRGYVRCDVTPTLWRSDYRTVPHVQRADVEIATSASWVTPKGTGRVERG